MNEENKKYQLTCLFSVLSAPEELSKVIEKIKNEITTQGGSFIGAEVSAANLVKKRLAYPIDKHQEAFLLNIDFVFPIKLLNAFKEQFLPEEDIIRFIVAVKEKEKKQPEKKIEDSFDFELVDKVEPLSKKEDTPREEITVEPKTKEAAPKKDVPIEKTVKEKVKIEELDKKLEEILNQ